MSDIRITPGSSIMSFTSSLNYVETLKQDDSGSLNLYGSGSLGRTEIFSIDGNNGRLFTVTDDLSDSLFSVNTIAGLPVIEAFADNTVVMGQYGTNALVVSGSKVGIGTSSPSKLLTVRHGDAEGLRIEYNGNNNNLFFDASNIQAYNLTNPSDLKINPFGGKVFIGNPTLITSETFQVNGSGYFNSNVNVGGGLTINGSLNSGGSNFAGYRQGGDNIILKGNSAGVSGIFFQSEKDGTNINHPTDYGYIQFHSYGIDGTSGESNKLVIGVANDVDDTVVLQSPYKNGVKISYLNSSGGTGGTEYTVWHAGNHGSGSGLDADLLDGQHSSYFLNTSSWNAATLSYSGSTLTLTINGVPKSTTINAGTNYDLPTANATTLGGVKLFSDTVQSVASNAVTTTASRTYGVQLNSSGQMVVNVPWVDTNTNTTYSAGTGLTLSGTTFTPTFGTTAGTVAQGNDSRITNGQTAYDWDNHASAGYAKADGTNATNNWNNTSSGLSLNPTVSGKTLNASGQTVNLKDATYGVVSGIVQDNTELNQWTNRLKTLHNNSQGYFTELAQSFTGVEGVWHRRKSGGANVEPSPWKQLYDDSIWNAASLSYSGSTLTLTINGIQKTTTINAGTNTNIAGIVNYIPKFTASGTIGNSLIYENGPNIGINTTDPVSSLEIRNTSTTGSTITLTGANAAIRARGYDTGTVIRDSSTIRFIQNPSTFWVQGSIEFATVNSSNLLTTRWSILPDGTFQSNGAGVIQTSASNLNLNAPFGDVCIMPQSNKNVGIGTISPDYKLDVNGGVRITGDLIGNVDNINLPSGTSYGVFYASQTIGGVNAFSYKSKDDSDQNSYGRAVIYACPQDGVVLYSDDLSGTNESRISLDHGNTYIKGTNFVGISTGIGVNSGYKLYINSSGNVGIGTTTLGARLDVRAQGSLATDIVFRVRNSADTQNILAVNGAGDITDYTGESIYLKLVTVSGNTTITNCFHNKIVRITASCTITIPTGLRRYFNCTFEVIGEYTAQFVDASGVTTSAPFGRYLKTDLTAMFYCTGTASNYRLNGSLATS